MRLQTTYFYLLALFAVTILAGCGSTAATTAGGASSGASSQSLAASQGGTADGAALYAANCAGCHGALASSRKTGITLARLQSAISNNVGGMGVYTALSASEAQAIVAVLSPATTTPAPTPVPVTPGTTVDGAALYSANCADCHGPLASSGKAGITVSRLQNAIGGNTGGMGALSGLAAAEVEAIVAALAPSASTPSTPPAATDGASLYSANCAGCHGTLATSAKAGVAAVAIQNAINGNTGSMGYLSTLTASDLTAIASALSTVTPSPTPAAACGSCHAIPPATGKHAKHLSQKIACETCHGTGYSTTTYASATHNNGVKNIDTVKTGWNATTRSCSNSCHGRETW